MSFEAIESIAKFSILFIGVTIIQHLFMKQMYKSLFIKLKKISVIGDIFDRPAVMVHELVGHLIPAILSGAKIIDVELREEKGHVGVKYSRNLFGMISVFISAFGPTFFLPLLFMFIYAYLNSYDPIAYITSMDIINNLINMIADISNLDEIKDVILLYVAVVIAPGAASSTGDIKTLISFIKNCKGLTLVWTIVWVVVLYISYVLGTHITDVGIGVIINSFAAYITMYIASASFLLILVNGWKNRTLIESMLVFVGVIALAKIIAPQFGFPLIAGLACADVIALTLKNKK